MAGLVFQEDYTSYNIKFHDTVILIEYNKSSPITCICGSTEIHIYQKNFNKKHEGLSLKSLSSHRPPVNTAKISCNRVAEKKISLTTQSWLKKSFAVLGRNVGNRESSTRSRLSTMIAIPLLIHLTDIQNKDYVT